MAKARFLTGLDIGSGTIKIIAAQKKADQENYEVLSYAQAPSFGVRKGVVVDSAKVSEIISSLVKNAEDELGQRIYKVYASIGGGHIGYIFSHGLISVSRADQKISDEDIDRVLNAAKTFSLPSNKEILDIFPKEFIVDGERGIKNPFDMKGVRLEVDVLALCGFSPYLKNSGQAITACQLQGDDMIPSFLASSKAVLTPREKELGVVVLDIGAGTTGMAVYEEGGLIGAVVFPIGSSHITNDIAICMKTDIDTAERIKLEYGLCRTSGKSEKTKNKIKVEGEESDLSFSPKQLSDIVEARISEIFDLVSKELKKISATGSLPAGVVLTGGGAKLPGIKEMAKQQLKLPCRIGYPKFFPQLANDPSYSALCGLAMQGFENEGADGASSPNAGSVKDGLKKIFKMFMP